MVQQPMSETGRQDRIDRIDHELELDFENMGVAIEIYPVPLA